MAADYVTPELRSAAAGFVTLFFGIGQVLGPSIGGYIINTTNNFATSFYLSFIVSIIGAILALFLKKPTSNIATYTLFINIQAPGGI